MLGNHWHMGKGMGNSVKKNKALIKACKANDLEGLKKAFVSELNFWQSDDDDPAEINCTDGSGDTPLAHAAQRGYRSIVEDILSRGAAVNPCNRKGVTPLMKAAEGGYNDVLASLLAKGADINVKDNTGRTALMYAAEAGKSGAVDFLLDRDADVNIKDNKGCAALWWAARRGDAVSLRALIEHGADIDAQNNEGNTALSTAAYREKESAVEMLLAYNARADLKNNNGSLAEDRTNTTAIEKLLKAPLQRQRPEKAEPSGVTPAQSGLPDMPQNTLPQSPIGAAMECEGLDPAQSEHWIPMGDEAVDYVQASVQSPRFLSTSFNFAAQQFSSISGNLLTGDRIVTQSGGLEEFPNQNLVVTAYEKLIELGKAPRTSALYTKPPSGPR